jgi:outer membrane protein assembly factor BamB
MLLHRWRRIVLAVLLAFVLPALVLAAPAATKLLEAVWPTSRNDAPQTGATRSGLPDKLVELWKFNPGPEASIESAVAVANGVVFVPSLDDHLYAVDLASGKKKWKYKAGPFKAAPAVRDGVVYAGDLDGMFHAIGAARGEKRWKFETGAELTAANFFGEQVLFSSHDEHLYCLNKNGKQRWKFKTNGQIFGSPAVAGGRTFLVGCDSKLHVIDIARGKEERSVELGGQTAASAAVLGDQLYVGTMKNEVLGINWKQGKITWTYRPRRPQGFFSSPAVTDSLVVIGCRDNRVHAITRKTGKPSWTFLTGGRVDSSPVIAGTRVVAGSMDGKLYILDLNKGRKLQAITLDGPISASPVVVAGRVLIGTQKGTLYCLGAKK